MSNFRVGQKVVCVDDSPGKGTGRAPTFSKGEVCEVTRLEPLYECVAVGVNGEDWTWHPSRFRPVVERKTDISIFTQMLGPQRELVSLTTGERPK